MWVELPLLVELVELVLVVSPGWATSLVPKSKPQFGSLRCKKSRAKGMQLTGYRTTR